MVAELAPAPRRCRSTSRSTSPTRRSAGRRSGSSMVNGAFVHELADCRTFCRRADVEAMQAQRPGARRLARQRGRGRGRQGAEPRRPAPRGRVRAAQDARRARRPRAGRRADPRRLPRRAGRARRDQPRCCGGCSRRRAPGNGSRSTPRRRASCPARASARRTCAAPAEAGRTGPERSPHAGCAFRFNPPESCANSDPAERAAAALGRAGIAEERHGSGAFGKSWSWHLPPFSACRSALARLQPAARLGRPVGRPAARGADREPLAAADLPRRRGAAGRRPAARGGRACSPRSSGSIPIRNGPSGRC